MKLNIAILFLCSLFLIFLSCEKENEENISYYNDDESHKEGKNCMNCHKQGGQGEGWFIVAGTVYDEQKEETFPNATIKFYAEPNGEGNLLETIEGDALGNFFTTQSLDFGDGIYVAVEGNTSTQHMITPVSTGACNSCHGVTTSKIWTK